MSSSPTAASERPRPGVHVRLGPLLRALQAAVPAEGNKGDRGSLAALRRALGDRLAFSPEVAQFVERYIDEEATPGEAEAAYLIAALFAHYPHHARLGEFARQRCLGRSLRALRFRDGATDQGLERRFVALLDASRDELPTHLRQMFQLMASRGQEPVDFEQLFYDLLEWDHPERRVQRTWATAFWREERPADGETTS
jgi:CRISPR system Cascade subunit CasB